MNKEIENAFWSLSTGKEYKEAFYILIGHFSAAQELWSRQVGRPSYYCAGLAIEHFLKGYLYLNKISFPTNGKGHNLNNLISLNMPEIKIFFELDTADIRQISLLNERYYSDELYGKHDLRYGFRLGTRKSPHPDALYKIVEKLATKLEHRLKEIIQNKS